MTPPAEDEPDPLTIVELLLAADPLAELELPPLDWPALVLVLELELVPFVAPSPAEPVPLPQALTASPTHAMQSASTENRFRAEPPRRVAASDRTAIAPRRADREAFTEHFIRIVL